ncbi:histidinol dehydrogenase [Bacillus pacificus]
MGPYLFYTKKFDGVKIKEFRVSEEEEKRASMFVENSFLEALQEGEENIISYHEKQKDNRCSIVRVKGIIRGQIIRPLENVGVYVPGGTASYPSVSINECIASKTRWCEKDCNGNTAKRRRN